MCVLRRCKQKNRIIQFLQHIHPDVYDNEAIPDAWKRGTITKRPKKGNLSEYSNWRGITLLSITSKVFCRINLQYITTAVDKLPRQEQAGFGKGKSYIDHILVLLQQILEQSHEWNRSLYVVFVVFEKAFKSLHRPSFWNILRHHGIPLNVVDIIQVLYEKFECRVIHNN